MKNWLIIILAAALTACGNGEQERQAEPAGGTDQAHERSVNITTAMSTLRDVEVIEEALGRILDPAASMVAAEIAARVLEVHVDAGDHVPRGAIMARLDASDMEAAVAAAEANLVREQSQAEAQARLVARYRQLVDDKFVSATTLDHAEAQRIAMQKAARAARAQLKQAQNNLARTRVIAPVAGVIQERFVAAGDYISAGKPMFQLVTDNHFVVSIAIPETKIETVRLGTPVRLHLPGNEERLQAQVTEIGPMIGAASNAFEARVKIRNPGNWRPGGSVIARLILDSHKQAVVVPEECVVLRPAGTVVYIIDAGRARARPVQTGVRRDGYVEILSGLETGITVAATGAPFLSDGAAVRVTETAQ